MKNNIEWMRKDYKEWKGLNGIGACVLTITHKEETTTVVSYSIYNHREIGAEEYGKNKRPHW